MKTLIDLEKKSEDLEHEYYLLQEQYQKGIVDLKKLNDKINFVGNKIAEISNKITDEILKNCDTAKDKYFIFSEANHTQCLIFEIFKICDVTDTTIHTIEYVYNSNEGDLSFSIEKKQYEKSIFATLLKNYQYIGIEKEQAERILIKALNFEDVGEDLKNV